MLWALFHSLTNPHQGNCYVDSQQIFFTFLCIVCIYGITQHILFHVWPVLLSISETDSYCSIVVNYSLSLLVFHYVNVPPCIILLFMGIWVVSMNILAFPLMNIGIHFWWPIYLEVKFLNQKAMHMFNLSRFD